MNERTADYADLKAAIAEAVKPSVFPSKHADSVSAWIADDVMKVVGPVVERLEVSHCGCPERPSETPNETPQLDGWAIESRASCGCCVHLHHTTARCDAELLVENATLPRVMATVRDHRCER